MPFSQHAFSVFLLHLTVCFCIFRSLFPSASSSLHVYSCIGLFASTVSPSVSLVLCLSFIKPLPLFICFHPSLPSLHLFPSVSLPLFIAFSAHVVSALSSCTMSLSVCQCDYLRVYPSVFRPISELRFSFLLTAGHLKTTGIRSIKSHLNSSSSMAQADAHSSQLLSGGEGRSTVRARHPFPVTDRNSTWKGNYRRARDSRNRETRRRFHAIRLSPPVEIVDDRVSRVVHVMQSTAIYLAPLWSGFASLYHVQNGSSPNIGGFV